MRKRWIVPALLIFFVPVWIVCAVIMGQYYIHAERSHPKGTYAEDRQFHIEVADVLAQWVMAGGAVVLVYFTIKGVKAALKTFKQAQKSNDIADRALIVAQTALDDAREAHNAFIESQRGRIEVEGLQILFKQPGEAPLVGYLLENFGSLPVTVVWRTFHVSTQPAGVPPPHNPKNANTFWDHIIVPPGKTFGVGANRDLPPLDLIPEMIDPDREDLMAGRKVLFVQMAFNYTTFGRNYFHCSAWQCTPATGFFIPFPEPGYNYHGPEEGIKEFLATAIPWDGPTDPPRQPEA